MEEGSEGFLKDPAKRAIQVLARKTPQEAPSDCYESHILFPWKTSSFIFNINTRTSTPTTVFNLR